MEQDGGPGFLKTALIGAATAAVVYGVAVLILSLESHAPQAPAASGNGSSSSPSRSQPAALSHPLACDVRIADGMTSVSMSRERCYTTKVTKEMPMNEQILDQEAENVVLATARVLGLNETSLPALRVLYAAGRMDGAIAISKIDWNVRAALGLPEERKPS